MKKTFLISAILLMSAGYASAQLKVANNGRVGINIGSSVPLSRLSLNCTGDTLTEFSINKTGPSSFDDILRYFSYGNTSFVIPRSAGINATNNHIACQDVYAIKAKSNMTIMGKCVGLYAMSGPDDAFNLPELPPAVQGIFQTLCQPKSYGVYATAGNLIDGYNYGVFGALKGTRNGAGIYGATTETSTYIPGKYAGYFYGQTRVSDAMLAGTFITTSDERVKTNVNHIKQDALSAVDQLNPVQFQFQQVELDAEIDTLGTKATFFSPDMDFERLHYGFIAQEVRELYPNLVHEDGNGFLSVNYQEIIPLLVMAIKDLKQEVRALRSGEPEKKMVKSNLSEEAILYQNNPNPFDYETEIKYYLPDAATDAALYIYDMNGTQIKKYIVADSGDGSVTIQGSELQAGMYLYSLIAEGQVIDTKRMILTK